MTKEEAIQFLTDFAEDMAPTLSDDEDGERDRAKLDQAIAVLRGEPDQ